ncbi:uncharacterized protein PV06_11147 [Exophiala oligosperma]|uniref:Uncharacterized protein n=1 Tax=Exophiala oligosperma TaxID=215243 RepID=A0A0D2D305_9EURO|nr:uncharacterized protein PV06_11147 [Exophiala oligosperma]KIW36635.1 hypothetical protein PV06_11147 [Exophiala oligosperma]
MIWIEDVDYGGEADGIATVVDCGRLRLTVHNRTAHANFVSLQSAKHESLVRFEAMGSSAPFGDLFSSDDFDSQGFLHAPTPRWSDQADSVSPFSDSYPSLSTDHQRALRSSTPCLRPHLRAQKLTLLQPSEWDQNKTYNDDPPICLCITIGWKVTLNGKPFRRDTEQDVVLTLASYWELFLHSKVEDAAAKKRAQEKAMTLQGAEITVSVKQRGERPLIKQYNETNIDWSTIEKQLIKWGEVFPGKELRVDLSVNYKDSEDAGQQLKTSSAKRPDKRSARSATQQMRAELDAELDDQQASGKPAIWPGVFHLFRCLLSSCNAPNYCWPDPVAGVHRKLNNPMLKKLVKYAEDGNPLNTPNDVPEGLREEIRLEDQQRYDRKRKARAVSPQHYPPVNITNYLPGHPEPASLQPPDVKADSVNAAPKAVSALDIPGFRDDAVKDYVHYLQSKVRNKRHQAEFEKAGNIVLDDFLDLDQVYQEHNTDFFTARDVKLAPAIQFIRDIPAFVRHRQAKDNYV